MSDRSENRFVRSETNAPPRDSTIPRFHMAEVLDATASAMMGRKIYREEERVQFLQPASNNKFVARVTDEHRQRWPDEYGKFKRGHTMAIEGTPIEQWSFLPRGVVAELKALEIHTVEQCAALNDNAVDKIGMGGLQIRTMAKAYLDEADAAALLSAATHQNGVMTNRIAELELQVKNMADAMAHFHSQVMARAEAPSAVDVYLPPDSSGPSAHAPAASALSAMAALQPRRMGRPTNAEREARAAAAP